MSLEDFRRSLSFDTPKDEDDRRVEKIKKFYSGLNSQEELQAYHGEFGG